jgi:protein-disulfide isomerase
MARAEIASLTTRRAVVAGLAGAPLALSLTGSAAWAQAAVNMDQVLAATDPLTPDLIYGEANAKVTIVEYASTTCSHCARFRTETFPQLKAKYIDTGKVRMIFRHFVLNPLDMAASMLSYCGPADKRGAFLAFLFSQQERWAFTNQPLDSLMQAARQAGFTQESFMACLQRQDLYAALNGQKDRAAEAFRINSTPTLIINGQVHRGALTMAELDRILQPLVGA